MSQEVDTAVQVQEHFEPNEELRRFAEEYFPQKYPGLTLELVNTPEKLAEVAALDQELFSSAALTAEDFGAIIRNGGMVMAVRDENGKVVAETAAVFNTDPTEGPSQFERYLPGYSGYCDGIAVHFSQRGKGLARDLLRAGELASKQKDKEVIGASVRQNNIPSIKSLIREGYVIVSDAPYYYGQEITDARIFLAKIVGEDNPFEGFRSDHEGLDYESRGVTAPDKISEAISNGQSLISVEVTFSEVPDPRVNKQISTLLANGYMGVVCHDLEVGDGVSESPSVLVFVSIDSVNENPVFQKLATTKKDFDKIFASS